jgi:predicted nucleic acid-binding protein
MTRVALDSNVLAYLAGVSRSVDDEAKIAAMRDLIDELADKAELIAPVQTLGELFVVLRRSGASARDARAVILEFMEGFGTSATEDKTAVAAADLVVDHQLQFWDALIVTAAADAGCTILLSEDMHHDFVTRGLVIVDPFREKAHPKLAALLL